MSTPENKKPNTGRAEVLSPERHGALRFHKATDFAFATDWLFVPVHYKEASRLSQSFPVLFYPLPNGGVMPCMLMKAEGKHAISANLAWQGSTVPDVIRLYPFGVNETKGRSRLAVYPDAPHFEGKGEKIITSKGKPTQKLNRIIKQLSPIQKAFGETRVLMHELNELNVLQPLAYTVTLAGGERTRLKLLCCPDTAVLKKQSLSARLRTLLYVHQKSCRRMFARAANTANKTDITEKTQVSETAPEPEDGGLDLPTLIQNVCGRYDVSLDDLRSRKRSEEIKKAREALAAEANAGDCLKDLAIHLERSVETVKKWL